MAGDLLKSNSFLVNFTRPNSYKSDDNKWVFTLYNHPLQLCETSLSSDGWEVAIVQIDIDGYISKRLQPQLLHYSLSDAEAYKRFTTPPLIYDTRERLTLAFHNCLPAALGERIHFSYADGGDKEGNCRILTVKLAEETALFLTEELAGLLGTRATNPLMGSVLRQGEWNYKVYDKLEVTNLISISTNICTSQIGNESLEPASLVVANLSEKDATYRPLRPDFFDIVTESVSNLVISFHWLKGGGIVQQADGGAVPSFNVRAKFRRRFPTNF